MTPIPHVHLRAGARGEQYEAAGPAARVRTMSHVQESLFEVHGEGEYPARTALRARR